MSRIGRVFEIREFTLHDGAGIRTTVFFKGCPLRCAWCHNPEGQSAEFEVMTRKDGTRINCGQDWTAADLTRELLRNADIMRESGGGITFSGGEPLAQADFLDELIPQLHDGGVTIALETSGYAPSAVYRRIVSQMDFVYQDLKHHERDAFRRWTGGDLSVVLENVAWLKESGVPHSFRVPVIPRVNDQPADRDAFAALAHEPDGSPIEYLPYNRAAAVMG